ncbi:hypothetical protein [Thermasporomyces composti]|jgi:hypothetical protein|uniref:Uncharacterized protein n=1 Tax=Thermasporomyces composti TaxID=696763 RepID=A0A3D9V7T0_THECX|nr:hypothetical protein [Thermasporomyces composti]REF36210.1 hypothetical protein DFJ64_1610 [Thermasporomyces composti]
MTGTAAYTLRHHDEDLAVEVWVDGDRNKARLLVDDQEVATVDGDAIDVVTLAHGPHTVRLVWWWRGRVARCVLVEGGEPPSRKRTTPFKPPEGTLAARVYRFQEEHPKLYAARHVVVQVVGVLFGFLGVSALLRSLLPSVNLDWLPSLPDIDIDPPRWLRYVDPIYWLRQILPDLEIPVWLQSLPDKLGWLQYVVPILIAMLVAIGEVRRRQGGTTSRERATGEEDVGKEPTKGPRETR